MQNFLSIVGQLKFRGTSVLFRLPRTPVTKKAKKKEGEPVVHDPSCICTASSLTLSLSPSFSPSLPLSLFHFFPLSLPLSLPPSLPPSFPPSLPPSLSL